MVCYRCALTRQSRAIASLNHNSDRAVDNDSNRLMNSDTSPSTLPRTIRAAFARISAALS